MKKTLLLLTLFMLSFAACKKDQLAPEPLATFTLGDPNVSSYIRPDEFYAIPLNESKNATSYLWDFGDGRTSTEKAPAISYKEAGTYILSLTATNTDGRTATTRMSITILKPFLKNFTIRRLSEWQGLHFHTLRKFKGGDIWVEVYKPLEKVNYEMQPNTLYNYPLYYKSAVIKNVPANAPSQIIIDVNEEIALDGLRTQETQYVYTVFVRDADGTHVLISSDLMLMPSSKMPTSYDLLNWEWLKDYGGSSAALVFTYK